MHFSENVRTDVCEDRLAFTLQNWAIEVFEANMQNSGDFAPFPSTQTRNIWL